MGTKQWLFALVAIGILLYVVKKGNARAIQAMDENKSGACGCDQ